jgi:hypothetical protein
VLAPEDLGEETSSTSRKVNPLPRQVNLYFGILRLPDLPKNEFSIPQKPHVATKVA